MLETLDGIEPYMIESCKGYGCVPAKYMFVGISAGKLGALRTEVPFTKDMSGRLFQRALYRLGLSKTADEKTLKPELVDCYITNLVKGRILDDEGNNRLPMATEIAYWIPKINHEILEVKPWQIIALGNLVYNALIEYHNRGALVKFGGEIVKAIHPRGYGSRGAISLTSEKGKASFEKMIADYRALLK